MYGSDRKAENSVSATVNKIQIVDISLPSWYCEHTQATEAKSVHNEAEKQTMQAPSAWLLPKEKYMRIYS